MCTFLSTDLRIWNNENLIGFSVLEFVDAIKQMNFQKRIKSLYWQKLAM